MYVCSKCNSPDIQIRAWVNPNSNEYISDIDTDECWCDKCQEHTKLKQI